jgi:cation transport ATPase
LGRVDTIVLDKTGTRTLGKSEGQAVVPWGGVSVQAVLDAAAVAESRSEHPVGKTIVAYMKRQDREDREDREVPEPERFHCTTERPSRAAGRQSRADEKHGVMLPSALSTGLEAASEILVAQDGQLPGIIAVADTIRPEAKSTMRGLGRMRTTLLTGDSRAAGAAVARSLGISEVAAECPPEHKQAWGQGSGDSRPSHRDARRRHQ